MNNSGMHRKLRNKIMLLNSYEKWQREVLAAGLDTPESVDIYEHVYENISVLHKEIAHIKHSIHIFMLAKEIGED